MESPYSKQKILDIIPRGLDLSQAPTRLAFASCFDQDKDASAWTQLQSQNPDLMIMMGDNVYASQPAKKPILEQYKKLEKLASYRIMRESVPFLATWDDHDYGVSDGDVTNPDKQEARKAFTYHYPYIRDSTLLDQPGIFHSKILGGVKEGRGRRARVTPSADGTHQVITQSTDKKETILGDVQWDWLEDQLQIPTDFKIIVSSMQVLTEEHGYERWGHFPKEKQKLLDLIAKTKPKNLVILSGDRHFASHSKIEIPGWGPLYEMTSSPLNTPKGNITEVEKIYQSEIYAKENYGIAEFDWKRKTAVFEIQDMEGKTIQKINLKMR
jgi:alkaline phosphatase D